MDGSWPSRPGVDNIAARICENSASPHGLTLAGEGPAIRMVALIIAIPPPTC